MHIDSVFDELARSTRTKPSLRFLEIALVLVRLDHVARGIVNANHGIVQAAVMFRVTDRVVDRIRFGVSEPTEGQYVGNQIDAAFIFAWGDFLNVHLVRT